MLRVFLRFLREVIKAPWSDITLTLYIHQNHRHRVPDVERYWRKTLKEPRLLFGGVYYKRHNPEPGRIKIGEKYYGTVRVVVRRSTNLSRKISGWICGINDATCPVV